MPKKEAPMTPPVIEEMLTKADLAQAIDRSPAWIQIKRRADDPLLRPDGKTRKGIEVWRKSRVPQIKAGILGRRRSAALLK